MSESPRIWSFGGATLDEVNRTLLVDGEEAALSGKPFDVLVCLLRARGDLVSKEQLFERVWAGRIVTDASLSKAIKQVRRAIGDHDRSRLRTVHGHGFRLEAEGEDFGPVSADTPAQFDAHGTDDPEALRYFLMARQLQRRRASHHFPAIRQYYERALALDPKFAEARVSLALVLLLDDRNPDSANEALRMVDLALDDAPELGEAHAIRGRILLLLRRVEEAQAAVERAVSLQPASHPIQHAAAQVLLGAHQFERALQHAEQAAALDGEHVGVFMLAAQSLRALGRLEDMRVTARRGLERAEQQLAREPSNVEALMCGVVLHAYLGDAERFHDYAERALILDPHSANLHSNVVHGLVILGREDEAVAQLEESLPWLKRWNYEWARIDSDVVTAWKNPRFVELMEQVARQ